MEENIKVIYEDDNILALQKPSGIMVHVDGRTKEKTIVDFILLNYPSLKGVGEPLFLKGKEIDRPGIVHRLDKETSGVLLVVKNDQAFAYFKKKFKQRKVKKTYLAIVYGHLKDDRGVVDKAIGRSPKDFRRRLAGRGARGEMREAITEYRVLKRIEDKQKNKFSYLFVYPKTGRTHQIRVHMKYLNHPVVCDSLYSPKNICPGVIGRLALHAKSIEFKNIKGDTVRIESETPPEFQEFIKG